MEPLDFGEIARLLNNSGTTQINLTPIRRQEGGWSVYEAQFRAHTSTYPFTVVYLHAKATRESTEGAARAVAGRGEVHVVYPRSLEGHVKRHRRFFPSSNVKGFWTAKEYLISFIKQEIETYSGKLSANKPPYYIDPRVETPSGVPRRLPNPLLDFLVSERKGLTEAGALAVLLAEPGQGKTYMSKYIVHRLCASPHGIVPILIDSSQWHNLPLSDLGSLWRTIAHSFRHHEATIAWLEGHEDEFLRVTLKAEVFRIIFDGFDEYILRNRGAVEPFEVLETLAGLAEGSSARIMITSRTSFWSSNLAQDAVDRFLRQTGTYVYEILPFDSQHARNYFATRLGKTLFVDRAVQMYGTLRNRNPDLAGRGFVLSLVADLVERESPAAQNIGEGTELKWLMGALCEREVLRQKLPLTSGEQLKILEELAVETATGQDPTSDLLELIVESVKPDLTTSERSSTLEKLKSHPLLQLDGDSDRWRFRQEQIGIVLLGELMTESSAGDLEKLAGRIRLEGGLTEDLANMIVELLDRRGAVGVIMPELQRIVRILGNAPHQGGKLLVAACNSSRLGGSITIKAVGRFKPKGSLREERTGILLEICGGRAVEGLAFGGTISSFDLGHVLFDNCTFENVTWANCTFGEAAVFRKCTFFGGTREVRCEGLGLAQFEQCKFDREGTAWLNAMQIREGKKAYTADNLRDDIGNLLRKFLTKGGARLKTVSARNINRGSISASPHRDLIIETITASILERHHISGVAEGGYNVSDDAANAVRFYGENNILTGPVKDAFDSLAKKLSL